MDNTEEYTCLSLCTGYGGIELGLKRAISNLRTIAYVEIEAFACANLVSKMEAGLLDAAPIWTDIKTFNAEPFRDKVHIITAGYPCQPFSCAGKRQGESDPRHLWPHIARIIQTIRPVWFFGENVAGHLTLGFPEVYRSLRNLGYNVEAGLFSAAECGAPHQRCRLFMLAYSEVNRPPIQRKSDRNQEWGIQNIESKQQPVFRGKAERSNISLQPSELADTEISRQQTSQPGRNESPRPRLADQNGYGRWPARPGQQQYEWEEPRVILDNTKSKRIETEEQQRQRTSIKQTSNVDDSRNKKRARLSGDEWQEISKIRQTSKGQAESSVGRAVNGTSSRVDRLRLLGNGVVPQQAEKAFRYLYEMMRTDDG